MPYAQLREVEVTHALIAYDPKGTKRTDAPDR
jgi:hypothetical protein